MKGIVKTGLIAFGLTASLAFGQTFVPSLADPAIQYYGPELNDPVRRLQLRLEKGEAKLEYSDKFGFLEAVLRELKIPASSQTLVFSKTSLQTAKISPEHPRALYFGDEVYVGIVRGGMLEFTAVDPVKGAVFYTLEQKKTERPTLLRRNRECLSCHFTVNTMQVPGFLTRSVFADSAGEPILSSGAWLTDHNSPLNQRWGGWYVTGSTGERHLGKELKKGVNLTQYLTPDSDLAALMVLNHQVGMHNLVTRLGYEARLKRPELPQTIEATLRYLLFVNEPPLRDPAKGSSSFRAEFEKQGPADSRGRSLRQLDLEHRLLRYRCSFLIYSEAFDALPSEAKDPLYKRLYEILTGVDQTPAFSVLSTADRKAILEILRETKPSLPQYFRSGS